MALDFALLLLRVCIGGFMCAHGSQKLFGWFGGRGLSGTLMMMQKQRLRPARFWMWMAILTEVGGGLLFVLGLLDPLGALGLIAAMLMAMVLVTWPRFWGSQGGIEYNLLFIIPALVEALAGPGRYSLDSVLGLALPEPLSFLVGLLLVVVGVVVAVMRREPVASETASPARA